MYYNMSADEFCRARDRTLPAVPISSGHWPHGHRLAGYAENIGDETLGTFSRTPKPFA
jgi:hypothetical protein